MRIFLLRLLIGWWMIPTSFIVLPVLNYLLVGKPDYKLIKEFCHVLWYGLE